MSDRLRLCRPKGSRRTRRPALRVALLLLLIGALTPPTTRAADPLPSGQTEPLAPGLGDPERPQFYHLTIGSQVFPLEWTRCLEGPQTHRPFLEDLARFGFLPDLDDADGLPIGLTKAKAKGAASDTLMLGINCGACHVGQLTFRGKTVRIDGAPNMIRFVEFGTALAEAVRAAATDPAAFIAFQLRLMKQPEYRSRLQEARPEAARWLLELADAQEGRRRELVPAAQPLFDAEADWPQDPARGFRLPIPGEPLAPAVAQTLGTLAAQISPRLRGVTNNQDEAAQASEVLVQTLWILKVSSGSMQKKEALRKAGDTVAGPGRVDDFRLARNLMKPFLPPLPATSPTSIPHVWGTGQIQWLGWDSNTDSTMQRNIATAVALGATLDPQAQQTSIVPAHIFQLEELAAKIPPPPWPRAVFGPIDPAQAARGRALFAMHCAKCHPTGKLPAPEPFVAFENYNVGTDPNRAQNFKQDVAERSPGLDGSPGPPLPEGLKRLLQAIYAIEHVSPEDAKKWMAGRTETWQATGEYAGRPLVAIWATAPYLHNGSVPTLHDLLLPAAQRPKTFPIGGREFDPVKVGYAGPDNAPGAFHFDTDRDGNHNTGHEGPDCTDFSAEERMALLEYLKAS